MRIPRGVLLSRRLKGDSRRGEGDVDLPIDSTPVDTPVVKRSAGLYDGLQSCRKCFRKRSKVRLYPLSSNEGVSRPDAVRNEPMLRWTNPVSTSR